MRHRALGRPACFAALLLAAAGCGGGQSSSGPPKTGPPYSAEQLRSAYDVDDLINSNGCNGPCDGSGEVVAIFAAGRFDAADVLKFAPALAPSLLTVSMLSDGSWSVDEGHDATSDAFRTESELDIETVHAFAPGARIHVYEFPIQGNAPSAEEVTGDFVQFIDQVLQNEESVASISFGLCESIFTEAELREMDLSFQEARDQGITVFAASGDAGKKCTNDEVVFSTDNEVNYPASDPFVTAVGATALSLTDDSGYGSEAAWDQGETKASGGMFSRRFTQPVWQSEGKGVPAACCSDELARLHCDLCRLVPDVAANGSFDTGLKYCIQSECRGSRGGTSVAAPAWAGFAAIFDQYADDHRLARLGLAAERLYGLTRSAWPAGLHDVRDQQLPLGGKHLWGDARPNWDKASGLGSFNACKLVQELVAPAAGPACTGTEKAGGRVKPPPPATSSQTVAGSSGSHTITGRVEDNKFDCVLDSANDVSVADENGTIIGVAEMGPLQGPKSDCYEEFVIRDVPDTSFYKFEESGIVVATYSKAQLEAFGWKVPPLYQT